VPAGGQIRDGRICGVRAERLDRGGRRWPRDKETGDPVNVRTVFHAASLTKPIVSYAVLQLVDAGVLDLDEPLSRSIPSIVPDDSTSALITIRHVLTHTCGLQNILGKEPARIYFRPGSWFSYSSLGFSLLQSAVEITHKSES
jgi:CubicO group peptidase (beta-lactamase class C family)